MTKKKRLWKGSKVRIKTKKKEAKYTMIEIGEEYQSEQELRMSV